MAERTRQADLAPWSYEVADTKLARNAKRKHVVQLCLYSEIIAREHKRHPPRACSRRTRRRNRFKVRLHDYLYYCNHTRERFNQFVPGHERDTAAERCPHCGLCRWSEKCDDEWEGDGNLRLVAGLGASQAEKLRAEGITSIGELAKLGGDVRIQEFSLRQPSCLHS